MGYPLVHYITVRTEFQLTKFSIVPAVVHFIYCKVFSGITQKLVCCMLILEEYSKLSKYVIRKIKNECRNLQYYKLI